VENEEETINSDSVESKGKYWTLGYKKLIAVFIVLIAFGSFYYVGVSWSIVPHVIETTKKVPISSEKQECNMYNLNSDVSNVGIEKTCTKTDTVCEYNEQYCVETGSECIRSEEYCCENNWYGGCNKWCTRCLQYNYPCNQYATRCASWKYPCLSARVRCYATLINHEASDGGMWGVEFTFYGINNEEIYSNIGSYGASPYTQPIIENNMIPTTIITEVPDKIIQPITLFQHLGIQPIPK